MATPPTREPRSILAPLGETLTLWIVLILAGFSFGELGNEVDLLPYAKQFIDRTWLPHDWYLNLPLGHRYAYSVIAGPIVTWLGFTTGSVVLRLGLYLLLAAALRSLFRTLRVWFPLAILALFLFLDNQSLASGEWIVGGGESKVVAYALVLWSLSSALERRYRRAWAAAGLAVTFHILVGLYSVLCLLGLFVWNQRAGALAWRPAIRASWLFLLTGAPGLLVALRQLLRHRGEDLDPAWQVYVEFRSPHHLVPSAWTGQWVETLVLLSVLFLALLFLAREPCMRALAAYALGCVALFLVGLLLHAAGAISALRFYPFRLPDVMLLLLGSTAMAWLLGEFLGGRIPWRLPGRVSGPGPYRVPRVLSGLLRGIIQLLAAGQMVEAGRGLRSRYENERARLAGIAAWAPGDDPEPGPLLAWIEENTPREAIFLADPALAGFHMQAQRSSFVSFKAVPTAGPDILEWYGRIRLANGGGSPTKRGFAAEREISDNFAKLATSDLQRISDSYGVGYYVFPLRPDLDLPLVHETHGYALYRAATP